MKQKFELQSSQYEFPYHYLVDLPSRRFLRNLDWGLDYLSYMEQVISLIRKYAVSDILDVGCGDGYLLYYLARDEMLDSDARMVGLDVDEKAVKFAQAFCHGLAPEFLAKPVAEYDVQHSLITLVETLEHIPSEDLPDFTDHIDRLLLPSGTLVVSVPSTVRPVIEKHYRHYTLQMLQEYFPQYTTMEVHYVTARRNVMYQIIARLLSHPHFNLNFGWCKRLLFHMHDRHTRRVSKRRGAHIVAAFRKP